jgi:hypothetical protein
MKLRMALVILLVCELLKAIPVIHKFQYWGEVDNIAKVYLYTGWTNGFFYGRGARDLDLGTCLEQLGIEQTMAMIDKRHKDHPEKWSSPLGEQILEALTVEGAPCAGKYRP